MPSCCLHLTILHTKWPRQDRPKIIHEPNTRAKHHEPTRAEMQLWSSSQPCQHPTVHRALRSVIQVRSTVSYVMASLTACRLPRDNFVQSLRYLSPWPISINLSERIADTMGRPMIFVDHQLIAVQKWVKHVRNVWNIDTPFLIVHLTGRSHSNFGDVDLKILRAWGSTSFIPRLFT